MLPLEKIKEDEIQNVRISIAYLFSPEAAGDNEFIRNLDLEEVKKAFRRKVKLYHPDLPRQESREVILKREERLKNINQSYAFLNSILRKYWKPSAPGRAGRGKLIAIGGAKGGIGKSIFAANLGVLLSARGFQTVVADFDLGGANLHLFLGNNSLPRSINDFLNNNALTLQDILVENDYGPRLIGGDSSELGAANISFSRKLRLLKAVRQLDADYVVIDLGGDTSYNIIDFFLAADRGLVLTTRDPASYLDAYRFIKVALYRKLTRLFGPESIYGNRKDPELEKIINEATISPNGSKVKNIDELIEKLRLEKPQSLPLLCEVLASFRPYLVVNKVTPDFDPSDIVRTIRDVSRRMLSIEVIYLGNIPYQLEIERSARELVPVVAKYPDGELARKMSQMIETIL